jgi:phosphoglycolate phosphatase-like HAD superfamily hydrolase
LGHKRIEEAGLRVGVLAGQPTDFAANFAAKFCRDHLVSFDFLSWKSSVQGRRSNFPFPFVIAQKRPG